MKVLVAGATGFIGCALVRALRANDHDVRRLVRGHDRAPDAVPWDPATRALDASALAETDVVINLAGENIGRRWTRARRRRIRQSRLDAAATLVEAVSRLRRKPEVLINASAVGYYGDRGDEVVTESAPAGAGFLADVCAAWEAQAQCAVALGMRVVMLRFGVVLGPDGGALGKLLPLFRLGLGGRVGSGRQWMSWISRDDVIGAIRHVMTDARCSGPFNVTAPVPVTNADFTRALAARLHRPAVAPVPGWALRLAFGRMANETLLASTRALPGRLQETGCAFRHPTLDACLRAVLGRP